MDETMTNEQIDQAVALFRAQLKKHQGELPSEFVQPVLGQEDLGPALFSIFCHRAEEASNTIVRRVRVDRSLSPQ